MIGKIMINLTSIIPLAIILTFCVQVGVPKQSPDTLGPQVSDSIRISLKHRYG